MTNDTNHVRLEQEGYVATIVIDRPEKLNAMTVAMDRRMNQICYEINNTDSVRSVVLTGAGERAFCVGSDVNDLDEYGSNWQYRNRFDRRNDYARAIWLIRKPIVAAVHGYCLGGGLEMACASDIRIASDNASFGAAEIKLGWHGGSGQTQLLTHLVGPGQASRLLLTGEPVDAVSARDIGLVNQVVPRDQVVPEATALAEAIAEHSPIAAERTKHMVRIAQNVPLDTGLMVENDSFSYLMLTEDAKEGRMAFAEKRAPSFKGR